MACSRCWKPAAEHRRGADACISCWIWDWMAFKVLTACSAHVLGHGDLLTAPVGTLTSTFWHNTSTVVHQGNWGALSTVMHIL